MPPFLINIVGILAILLIAFLLSNGKRRIRLRVVGAAFALQAFMAFIVLATSGGRAVIQGMADGVAALLSYADQGTQFLFGPNESNPLANTFALGALPVIIFFAALVSILYYLGIMQRVVRWVGGAIGWVTGISQVEIIGGCSQYLCWPVGKPAGGSPLSGRANSKSFVHLDGGRHGRCGGHNSGCLRRVAGE